MAFFFFIDESGQDHRESPYEVLAAVAIKDEDLWNLIRMVQELEMKYFGKSYRSDRNEIKARKFIKRKTFRLAAQLPPIPMPKRTALAMQALIDGAHVTKEQLTALAQAKLAYVQDLIDICNRFRCKAFAAIVSDKKQLPTDASMLRKDYVYLFERIYYFLEDRKEAHQGIIVFDELDKSVSHLLLDQMDKYFKMTRKGKLRSNMIIPEPFFVHSDLTTGIQIVDFIAYIVSWSFRVKHLDKPIREELKPFLNACKPLRYLTTRSVGEISDYKIWSFTIV